MRLSHSWRLSLLRFSTCIVGWLHACELEREAATIARPGRVGTACRSWLSRGTTATARVSPRRISLNEVAGRHGRRPANGGDSEGRRRRRPNDGDRRDAALGRGRDGTCRTRSASACPPATRRRLLLLLVHGEPPRPPHAGADAVRLDAAGASRLAAKIDGSNTTAPPHAQPSSTIRRLACRPPGSLPATGT